MILRYVLVYNILKIQFDNEIESVIIYIYSIYVAIELYFFIYIYFQIKVSGLIFFNWGPPEVPQEK